MTEPTSPQQPDPSLIAQHEVAAVALETAAVTAVTAAPLLAVSTLFQWITTEYLRVFGASREVQSGLQFQLFTQRVAARLRAIHLPDSSEINMFTRRARSLGIEQGLREAGRYTPELLAQLDGADMPVPLRRAGEAAIASADQKLRTAQHLTSALSEGTLTDVETAVSPAQHAVNGLKRDTTTTVHEAVNDGINTAIDHVDALKVWIAERDACTVCLALAGSIADEHGHFDVTATFSAKPYPVKRFNQAGVLETVDLDGPPRHPSCRCRITPWFGTRTPGPHEFPTLLRREAERSILNGYARPTDSVATRSRAAEQLLAGIGAANSRTPSGWVAPATVRTRATRAVKTGTFTTRRVPTGRR